MDKNIESPELVMPRESAPGVPDMTILNKAIAGLSIIDKPITWVSIAGMACLVAMVFVTFFDVCARYIFNRPLSGSNEIIGLLMVAVVFSGVAYAQITKSHITMDIVSSRLSERNRLLLSVFSYALSLIMLILIIYQSTSYAAFDTGDFTSNVLGIRLQPFTFIIPFGMALFFLSMAKDFLVDV